MPGARPVAPPADAGDLWLTLPADHPDLLFEMVQRLEHVATLPRVERERAVAALLDHEAALPEADLRTLVVTELRALISMPPAGAAAIVATLDGFLAARSADFNMRRQVALQRACRDLRLDEISRLESLMPAARTHAGLGPVRPPFRTGVTVMSVDPSARQRRWLLPRIFSRP